MFKRLVVLLAAPLALAAQDPTQGSTEPRYISLDEAIRLAQANSPAAIQARNNLRTASMTVRGSYLDLLPTLSASVGISRPLSMFDPDGNNGPLPPERVWEHDAGLSASMTLFDPARFYAIGEAKLRRDAAEISELTQRYNTSLQVKQQFFNALNARESEAAARAALATSEQSLRAATVRLRAGSAIRTDSLRAFIAHQNAVIRLLSAQNAARQASASLTRLVGSPMPVQADPADTANFAFVVLDSAALVAALDQAPAIRSAEINLEVTGYAKKRARSAYWPRLSSLSWSRSGSGLGFYGFDEPPAGATDANQRRWWNYRHSYTTGLNVSMPIWTGLNREDALVSARIQLENAEVGFRDQRAQLGVQLAQFIGQLRTTEAQIRLQELALAAAEDDYHLVELRYGLGVATQLELSTSQDALNSARQNLISQRHTYRIARAQIEALIGRDLQ
jgi:outer membrane protein